MRKALKQSMSKEERKKFKKIRSGERFGVGVYDRIRVSGQEDAKASSQSS